MAGDWSVGSATVDLIADLSKLSKGLDQAESMTQKKAGGIGKIFGTAFSFATGTLLADGIKKLGGSLTDFLGDAISESRDAAKGMAQTRAAIKSTGGAAKVSAEEIAGLAGQLSHTTLFTDDAIQAQQNLLLTFTNVRNEVGQGNDIFTQASKIGLDMAQALGTDAAGGAVALGKALNDPVAGITALTRVGVTFTDGQKEQIKTMVEAGDVMGAQKIILAELTKEFGGSAAAAAAADGGFHNFTQTMADMKQTIGDSLQPALQKLADFLNSPAVSQGLSGLAAGIARNITAAIDWIETTGIPTLQAAWQTVKDVIAGFQTGNFSGVALDLTTWFGVDGAAIVIDTLQKIREGWGLARDALVTFKEAWDGDWKNADTILPLHQAFGEFGITARAVFDWLATTGIPEITAAFTASMPGNIQFVNDLTTALTGLSGQGHVTSQSITADLNALSDPFNGVALWINTIQFSFNWLGQQTHAILLLAGADWQVFASQIASIGADIKSVLDSIGAAASNFSSLMGQAADFAGQKFAAAGTAITGQIAGIKLALSVGLNEALGIWQGLWTQIEYAVTAPMQRAQAFVNGAVENILGYIIHAIDRIQALISWIGKIPGIHVAVPSPGGGGGSGDQSNFGPGGGRGPQSFSNGMTVNNFYSNDNNLASRYLRQSGA